MIALPHPVAGCATLSPVYSISVSPILASTLGHSEECPRCMHYKGKSLKCGRKNHWFDRIFSFYSLSPEFPSMQPCRASWCAKYYTLNPRTKFHRQDILRAIHLDDDINKLWGRKRQSKEEFESARPGDHLHVPFQCDLCVFRCL